MVDLKKLEETRKKFRKCIDVTVGDGVKYFSIYEVIAQKYDGESVVYKRCLSKVDAESAVVFVHSSLKALYEYAFVYRQVVFC